MGIRFHVLYAQHEPLSGCITVMVTAPLVAIVGCRLQLTGAHPPINHCTASIKRWELVH